MSDPVAEAAQVLVPLLSAGADVALGQIARQAGEDVAATVRRVLGKLRHALGAEEVGEEKVAAVLRAEVEAGSLTEADIQEVTRVIGSGWDNHGVQIQAGKNVYICNEIKADQFNG